MPRYRRTTPEEREAQLQREREFRELLEKRKALDEKLRAEREQREQAGDQ